MALVVVLGRTRILRLLHLVSLPSTVNSSRPVLIQCELPVGWHG